MRATRTGRPDDIREQGMSDKPYDGTITFMAYTVTVEQSMRMRAAGRNIFEGHPMLTWEPPAPSIESMERGGTDD